MYVDDKSPEGHTSEAPDERDEGELYDNSIPITDDGDRRASGVESTPRHEDDKCDDDDDDTS